MPKVIKKYKEQQTIRRESEFMPATIEVLARPPSPLARIMVFFLIVFCTVVVCWAYFAQMDIVAVGTGVVVPKGKVKIVQSLEPGIVTEIGARDGQLVKKDELLLRMDSTESGADLSSLKRELKTVNLTIARLNAQLAGDFSSFREGSDDSGEIALHRRLLLQSLKAKKEQEAALGHNVSRAEAELASAHKKVQWLTQSLPLKEQLFAKKKVLAEQNMMSGGSFLQAEIEVNEARKELEMEKNRLDELELRFFQVNEEKQLAQSRYQQDLLKELSEQQEKENRLTIQLTRARKRHVNREIRSPIDGIVQQLSVNTLGGVVTAAQPLMSIVPTDGGLEIEAKILNKDIGFIRKDQAISVKVAAYPFTRHGDLNGRIDWVGRDAVMDEEMGPVYPVRVSVGSYQLPNTVNNQRGRILPGMVVTTDIKVGKRRVIHYFLEPVLRYKDNSLREL